MANQKNPTALFFSRMQNQGITAGVPAKDLQTLAQLLQTWFRLNFATTDLLKQVSDATLYDSKQTQGQTTIIFFQGTFSTNNSNMPSGSYQNQQSEHMAILGLRCYQGVNATIQATAWEPGLNTPALINGNMSISTNGTRQMRNIALTNFNTNLLSATQAGVTSDDQGFFYLIEPIAWLAQTALDCTVSFPTAPGVANLNMRVELHGLQFIG